MQNACLAELEKTYSVPWILQWLKYTAVNRSAPGEHLVWERNLSVTRCKLGAVQT